LGARRIRKTEKNEKRWWFLEMNRHDEKENGGLLSWLATKATFFLSGKY
jgi:hypothetical protein